MAIAEAHINIERKMGTDFLPDFYRFVSLLKKLEKNVLMSDEENYFTNYIVAKDIPILVGAMRAKVDYLITLDQKDFKSERMEGLALPFHIMLPGEYLQNL